MKQSSINMLRNGPEYLRQNCDKVVIIDGFDGSQTFANINTANLGSSAAVPADFTWSGAAGQPQVLTYAGISDFITATGATNPDLHVACLNTSASEIIHVDDITPDINVVQGVTHSLSTFTVTTNQPI